MRKRIGKRLVSAVLAVSMIVSMMPVQAFAKGMPRAESTVEILKQENDAGVTDDIIEIKIGSGISFGEAPSTDNMNTEFWSYGTNLLGVKTLTLKKGQFKLTGGALQDEIKLSIESGATFVDGKVNGEVSNAGIIEGGTFSHALPHTGMNVGPNGSKTQWVGGIVRNSGTITGGTFKGQLWNGGVVSGGVIYGEVYNSGEITGTSEFAVTRDDYGNRGGNPSKYGIIKNREGGIISGGSFGKNCQVTNQGTISGGKFEIDSSYYQIENSGGTITGGQFTDSRVLNGVLNYISGTISGGIFDNGYTVSNSGGVISGGTFRNGTVNNTGAGTKIGIIKGGIFSGKVTCDNSSKIEDGVFIGEVTGPTIYGGVFKNKPDAYYLSAAVRYANGTTTFSLLKNGNADVSGVLENVTVLYVASDTLAKEITIVPSTDVIDVSGNIKYNGKAGGPMQLRMEMRGMSDDLVLNSITKKIPKYEDFCWDQAQRKVVSDVPGMGVVTTYYKKTFIMPTQPGSYKITYKVAESEDYIAFDGPDDTGWTLNLYTVTVDGGTADNTVAAAGDTITLTRGVVPEGYSFAYWTLNDEKIEGDTFTMPDGNAVLKAHYDINSYILTVNGVPETKTYGDSVSVTAEDKVGRTFSGWTVEGVMVEDASSKTLEFTMPASDVTLTANYTPNLYELTIDGRNVQKEYDAEVTVTAKDEVGHTFTGWTVEGVTVEDKTSQTLHFRMPANEVKLTTNYSTNQYTLVENGVADKRYYHDWVTLQAQSWAGQTFDHWEISGVEISEEEAKKTRLTFQMPANDVTAEAIYTIDLYAVEVEGGRAEVDGKTVTAVPYGKTVTLVPEPEPGKEFVRWKVVDDNMNLSIVRNRFTMPCWNVKIKAVYKDIYYTITITGGNASSEKYIKATDAKYNERIYLKAVPENVGDELDYWEVNGQKIDGSEFNMPAENVTIRAVWKRAIYKLTLEGATAMVNGNPASTAQYGDKVSLTAEPPYGKEFVRWELSGLDGVETEAWGRRLTFKMPANDVTAKAIYEDGVYSIFITGGTVENTKHKAGELVQVQVDEAQFPEGQTFKEWKTAPELDMQPTDGGYTFTMPGESVTIEAVYQNRFYDLTVDGKTESREYGSLVKVTAPEKEGYTFAGWTVKGAQVDNPYNQTLLFRMPAGDVTLTPNYTANKYSLTVDDTMEFKDYGEPVTVTAAEKEGYTFTGWAVDGVTVADKTSKTLAFTMPAGNVTLTANYAINHYTLTVNGKAEQKEYGEYVYAYAEDRTGWIFTGWEATGLELTAEEKADRSIAFDMPAHDVTLTAQYEAEKYTLSVTDGTPENTTAVAGTEVTITANAPDKGMQFDHWILSDDLEIVSGSLTDTTITVKMPQGYARAIAFYTFAPRYTLLVIMDGYCDGESLEAGEEVALTAKEPAEGRQFDHWVLSDGLELVSGELTDTTITVRMPAKEASAEAVYKEIPKPKYTLTVTNGTPTSRQEEAGTEVVLTANAPAEGKLFDQWELSENLTLVSGNLTDEIIMVRMPEGNATAKATYKDAPKPEYTLTVISGTPENTTAVAGTEVTLTANTPAEGKLFDQWELSENLELVSGNLTDETITVRMPEGNATAKATYKDAPKPEYTLTVTSGTPENTTAVAGTEVTLIANTPAEGKLFDQWELSENLELVSGNLTDETITVRMPEGNATAKATYKDAPKPEYTLTVTNGTPASTTAEAGTEVTLTANTPAEGKLFDQWELSENLKLVSGNLTDETITVRMSEGNATAKATYKDAPKPEYTLTVTSGTPENTTAEAGTEVTLTANTPADGKLFDQWELSENLTLISGNLTDETITVRMPEGNATAKATYKDAPKPEYILTVTSGTPASTTAEAGTEVTLTVNTPAEGKLFDQWELSENLTLISGNLTDETITVRMPEGNATAKATYKDVPKPEYTLTVTSGTPASTTAEAGTEVTLTANTPAEGKLFDQWELSENLKLVSGNLTDETITVRMPEGNATAKATYKDAPKPEYTLTVTNGTPASTTAEAGTEVTLTANTPADGKLFDQWELSENLTLISGNLTDETITVRMPEGNATAKATYKDAPKPEYILTVTSGTPASTTAEAGTEVTLTANTPAEGKLFDQWELSENLTLISGNLTDETITVRMPEGNATAKATYKDVPKPEYTLTVTSGTPENTTAVAGTEVTLTANTPADGKLFDQWELSENLELVSGNLTDETITVRMSEGNATAKATYKDAPKPEPEPYTIEVQDGTAFVNGAEAAAALAGTEITIHAKAAPEGMKFSGWQVETPQTLELKDGTAAKTTFIMPDACVKISALYTTSEVPDPTPDASGGGAAIAAAAVGAAGAAIGIGVWAVNRYILSNLPVGMAVPTTRQQLAVVLWTMAGKPDVTPTVHYQDVAGLDAQKAVHWAVEQQLMQPESAEYFGTQGSVNKWQVFQLMKQVVK